MMISLSKENYIKLIDHSKKEFPIECCGLLGGKTDEDKILIKEVYSLYNIDQSSEHFTIDPKDQFETIKEIRKKGYTLIGNYHSHPYTPSRPSEEDKNLAFDYELVYAIISLEEKEPVLNFFKINPTKTIEKLYYEIF